MEGLAQQVKKHQLRAKGQRGWGQYMTAIHLCAVQHAPKCTLQSAHPAHALQRGAALEQHAGLRRARQGAHHCGRSGQHQSAGAGSDKDLEGQVDPVLQGEGGRVGRRRGNEWPVQWSARGHAGAST